MQLQACRHSQQGRGARVVQVKAEVGDAQKAERAKNVLQYAADVAERRGAESRADGNQE